MQNVISKLHGYGYLVEMDDFGRGYSSLNVLKDLFVGAAAIFEYASETDDVEILRVNKKYVIEVGLGRTEQQIIKSTPWENHDKHSKDEYIRVIKKAIESKDEEYCETWRTICTKLCGEEKICVRSSIRLIGNAGTKYLFYTIVQNITKEKKQIEAFEENEGKFKHAFEQANVYAWEVDLSNWEMRPCFRCMRDLHLPPVVKNYPEPAIEDGIFPSDYADMYRDMMKKLADGEDNLEAVIPLTVGRVPFHVRYSLEYDENGKPLKAYGSATLVVE
ncbi:MAG: PAS domain S-box protein [Synergistaceae bacterium]|nr:PAS domain S-box protein [Synergistaceae bacterium]